MRDTYERLKSDADEKKEEEATINKREEHWRKRDLHGDETRGWMIWGENCDPELRKDIDELAEISAENESLQQAIKLDRELKEAKSAMQEICDKREVIKKLGGITPGGVRRSAEREQRSEVEGEG